MTFGANTFAEGEGSDYEAIEALLKDWSEYPHVKAGSNFIAFQRDTGQTLAAIEGNGAGGVVYNTSGGDYAEYLPLAEGVDKSQLRPGQVVGVRGGRISLHTHAAEQIGVISTNPAVSGNDPGQGKRSAHALVAFLGQVDVAVSGPVRAGDFLIASGRNDGQAIAVAPAEMRTELIATTVGRAWATGAGGQGSVRALVGLNPVDAAQSTVLAGLAQENAALRAEGAELRRRLDRLEALLGTAGSGLHPPVGR